MAPAERSAACVPGEEQSDESIAEIGVESCLEWNVELRMKELIVPEDGFVVKTEQGRPILEIIIQDEGNFVSLFGADGEPKIQLATHRDGGALICRRSRRRRGRRLC